jgi:hypothetical protein
MLHCSLWLIASKIAGVRAIDERSITVRTSQRDGGQLQVRRRRAEEDEEEQI